VKNWLDELITKFLKGFFKVFRKSNFYLKEALGLIKLYFENKGGGWSFNF